MTDAGHRPDIRQALIEHGIAFRDKGRELWVECPWCKSPDGLRSGTASVNAESGAFRCLHANRCGQKGSFADFAQKQGFKTLRPSGRVFGHVAPPKSYTRPDRPIPDDSVGVVAGQYLRKRGLSPETVAAYQVCGVDRSGHQAIAFPCVDEHGEVVNVKFRHRRNPKDPDRPEWKTFAQTKGGKPCLWGKHLVPADAETLILTEGEIDCMTCHQLGGNTTPFGVASMPSGASNLEWIELDWEWLERFKTVVIATDMDSGGEEAAAKIVERLGRARCLRMNLPAKDLNDCLVSLNWTAREFLTALNAASEYRPDHLVSADDFTQKVLHPTDDDLERETGCPTPWASLDAILRGWRKAETTIVTGLNGSGKSTALYQIVVDLVRRGKRCCVASLETPPALYLRRMVMMAAGNTASPQERAAAWAWMSRGLYIVNLVEVIKPATLLEIFTYAAQRYGVEFCVTDSLMCLDVRSDDYDGQRSFVAKAKIELCQRHDVHHFLVAHPRKGQTDETTGQGRVDVSGTANITNLADNVITLLRSSDREKPTTLRLLKNRLHGLTGDIPLTFVRTHNTLREVAPEPTDEMPDFGGRYQ